MRTGVLLLQWCPETRFKSRGHRWDLCYWQRIVQPIHVWPHPIHPQVVNPDVDGQPTTCKPSRPQQLIKDPLVWIDLEMTGANNNSNAHAASKINIRANVRASSFIHTRHCLLALRPVQNIERLRQQLPKSHLDYDLVKKLSAVHMSKSNWADWHLHSLLFFRPCCVVV